MNIEKMSIIGLLMDKTIRKNEKVAVIGLMRDKNSGEYRENVHHQTHDGQNHPGKTKKWPSSVS
ncbi:hypothetical protein [Mesobacillus subterraneus]|uniref:hypothetical protein n=1 Tax=Mesobacillus subterraneus TaxID=285983 RepID=UPI001CFE0A64|nr:hypothetical protein [Mesobacillus subterraneus]